MKVENPVLENLVFNNLGITPVSLGFKVNLLKEKGLIPITSFIGSMSLPMIATKEFKSTFFAPSFRFVMQHTITERINFAYNLGAEWDGENAEPIFIYTVTSGFALTDKLGAYAEFYGFKGQKTRIDNRFDCGFTFTLNPNLMFDVSAGVGLSQSSHYFFVGNGFSFRF